MKLDSALLAEKAAAVERHLGRIAERLPSDPADLAPMSDASDAVILHLWQATQIVVDAAASICVKLHIGTPASYADAFVKLREAGHLEPDLAERLMRAAGFRNVVAHAYESLDLKRVFQAAKEGPRDLRAFFGAMARLA